MLVVFNASVLVRKKSNASLMAADFKSLVSLLCLFAKCFSLCESLALNVMTISSVFMQISKYSLKGLVIGVPFEYNLVSPDVCFISLTIRIPFITVFLH